LNDNFPLNMHGYLPINSHTITINVPIQHDTNKRRNGQTQLLGKLRAFLYNELILSEFRFKFLNFTRNKYNY